MVGWETIRKALKEQGANFFSLDITVLGDPEEWFVTITLKGEAGQPGRQTTGMGQTIESAARRAIDGSLAVRSKPKA